MDVTALYHMLRLELFHPKLFSFARDGPLPLFWKNLTTRSEALQTSDLDIFKGSTVLIAGATSGCGLALAKLTASSCRRLIMTARTTERGQKAVEEIRNQVSQDTKDVKVDIEVWPLEMESFRSIKEFVERLSSLPSLDFAILNAGVWHLEFARTKDAFETHLQVNYLASCALTIPLLTVLERKRSSPNSKPGRLMFVSSEGHSLETIPKTRVAKEILESFDDPTAWSNYQRYRYTKLLNIIWTHQLAPSIDSTRKVEIASFTPGNCRTQICRDLGNGPIVRTVINLFCQSAEEGAWTYVRALNAADYHGRYFFRGRVERPADCVTDDMYNPFREDLVQQTVALLDKHGVASSDTKSWLSVSI